MGTVKRNNTANIVSNKTDAKSCVTGAKYSEERLQMDIVVKFSQLYPNKRGQLFHVSNERNNKIQAFKARAIGIVNGVSDLIFYEQHRDGNMISKAIELKAPGTYHKREHIQQQIEWAKQWRNNNGEWMLCRSVEQAIAFIDGELDFEPSTGGWGLSIEEVEIMMCEQTTKNIKF